MRHGFLRIHRLSGSKAVVKNANQLRAEWFKAVKVERIQPPDGKGYLNRITFPNGEVAEVGLDKTRQEIEKRAAGEYPSKPSKADKPEWIGTLTLFDGSRKFDLPSAPPGRTLPLEAIVRLLDQLASEGWQVLQVSEDRQIADADLSSSYVSEVRYLLTRRD